jgi:kumamolisin
MRRRALAKLKKKGLFLFLSLSIILSVGTCFATGNLVALQGHVSSRIRTAAKIDRVSSSDIVNLSLVVNLDQGLLSQTLSQLYGPNAPKNKTFLTPIQFAQKFNLAQKRQLIKNFAAAAGLTLSAPDEPNSLIVKVSGPTNVVERALSLHLYHYRSASGQVFRANDSNPMIPSSLTPHLLAVIGLSNFRGALKPHLAFPVSSRPGVMGKLSPHQLSKMTGPGPGLAPADIQTVYGLSEPLNGSGQTLALLELDGYNPSDISAYESQFGLPNTLVTFKSIDGQANLCGPNQDQTCNSITAASDSGMTEVALDIELMIALASGASNILVYTPPNTTQKVLDAYSQMATDDAAKIISTSWGVDEEDAGGAYMASEATIFQQMATQGQAIFAAAGDNGAYDAAGMTDSNGNPVAWAGNLLTDDPASQLYVTGVGGTSLSGTIASHTEAVWNNASGAGGGGVANYVSGVTYWPIPNYQNGISGNFSQSYRNVPDVALNADPNSAPYSIYVGANWLLVGGTSAAAPLWAAFMALVNQQRSAPLGFANPSLYQIATSTNYSSNFNDITSGSNGYYNASTGYDNASGWGSFKGNALIDTLSNLTAPQNLVKEVQISNNPIRPKQGISNTTFSNLPANSKLRIYTISGRLVRDISANATGIATWNATNQSGRQVASGVYFVFVQGNGTKNVLKIAVQR